MKASILTIGDELLHGQTIDSNSAWLGRELNKIGVSVVFKCSVSDTRDSILSGLEYSFREADLVLVTGGLGPTKDDITKKVIVEFFEDQLVFDAKTYEKIASYFQRTGRQPREAHRLQAYMPSRAECLRNDRGTAPGMWIADDKRFLLSMPGVPSEMKGIMEDEGLRKIASLKPGQHIRHLIIQTAGIGETIIAERIEDILDTMPPNIGIAYLPGIGSVKLRLTSFGLDPVKLSEETKEYGDKISKRLGDLVFGYGDISLSQAVGELAREKGLSIGTAESCTGGSISRLLTSVSGASQYFKGSVIAYSNAVKKRQLNVKDNTLLDHGAVSEQTVKEMVVGLNKALQVDVSVAVSGIAGPTGGTITKPVGTIWIAVGRKDNIRTKKLQLVKNRDLNIQYSAIAALNELRLFLKSQ